MNKSVQEIAIEVFRADKGKRERCIYTLPVECDLIIVDEAVHKQVWGFLRGKHDDPQGQVDGKLQATDDGLLYG
ncbi:MAG: hypothetical protein WD851_20395 [Pirellulales bacterium]